MALRDQPYLPLYVQDFMTDEKLAECSAEANGVYIRIMCLMHKSEEYGKIALSGKDIAQFGNTGILDMFAGKLVKHMPFTVDVIRKALDELIEEKVLYVDATKLCQKRMIKDAQISEVRAAAGRKGADKTNQKAEKVKYAETVYMTEAEYANLISQFGDNMTKRLVEILDNYKAAIGKEYKSDYRAILSWCVDRYNKEQSKNGNKYSAIQTVAPGKSGGSSTL